MSGDMVGRVIKGRYKLIDELGRGSFATVYIARDTKTNRIYAMKVMHFELSEDGDFNKPTLVADETAADFPNPGDAPYLSTLKHISGRHIRITATRLWWKPCAKSPAPGS